MNYRRRLPDFDKDILSQIQVLAHSLKLDCIFDKNGTGE